MPRRFQIRNFYPPHAISFRARAVLTFDGISVFGSETRITQPIASKICTKNDAYEAHLSSKFQGSTFGHFKVIAFSTSGCQICH